MKKVLRVYLEDNDEVVVVIKPPGRFIRLGKRKGHIYVIDHRGHIEGLEKESEE